ncbi:laminin gamma-1 chain, putative, partial [Ixodes scapularis]
CNCNGRSRKCYFDKELYDRTGHGGHCINCSDNTDGPNCERCRENFYQRSDGRCVACGCDPLGSRVLQCNSKGQCPCKPGVEGQRCDRCAPNFYDFSEQGCRPCGCSMAGSVDSPPSCDAATGVCRCKANVEGRQCDRCRPGFFNLQRDNEFGCTPCFCFGHSAVCQSAPGYSKHTVYSTFTRDKEHWKAVDSRGARVPTRHEYAAHHLAVAAPGENQVYFVAPERFLGDQRGSYNQNLTFTLRIGEEGARSSLEDVVLESPSQSVSQHIFGQGNPLPSIRNQDYRFRLHQDSRYGWSPTLSAHEFMALLANLTAIKIRATYLPRGESTLHRLVCGGKKGVGGLPGIGQGILIPPDKFCDPSEYTTSSCRATLQHHTFRVSNRYGCPRQTNPRHWCSSLGHCICQHNTAGEFCERCAPRFYGNALVGSPEDCQPCPCPDQGACAVLPDESVVCLECPQGYSGGRCDLCFDGHFGDPQGRYGAERPCQKCDCNDNVDPNAVANCNTTTGECLKCIYKTAGFHCEKCLPGHYGDALAVPKGDCKRNMQLLSLGSTSDQCDPVTGQCPCRPNVAGRECGQCREGTWNLEGGQGCEQCGCHLVGSVNRTCDQRTGQCHCRPGVGGKRCDQCLPYHYGFSPDGCLPCDCDSLGSVSLQCAPDGQCECRPNVEGRRCERCKENKYNREAGCVDCPTCYNLVQDAVNQHRDKVADLARLLDNIEKNPQIVKSVDFEKKLEEVMVIVNDLWKDAKQASGTDKSLADRLEELVRRMHRVQETASKVGQETWLAEEALWAAQSNLSQAEASVERMGTTLAQAHRFLEDEGQHALRRALERSHRFGQQSEMMSQIARDARQLADRMKDIMDLMLRTKKMAEEAKAEVVKAYEDALRVYSDTTSVQMPDIDTDDLLHQAQEIIEEVRQPLGRAISSLYDCAIEQQNHSQCCEKEPRSGQKGSKPQRSFTFKMQAQRIYKEADDLMEKHKNIFDKVKPQKDEAEDLLAEAQRQQQVTDELLADTDAAYAKAKEAVQSGEKILEEAQNTLKTLKEFDENVKNSKEKARAALERVPEIRALIEEAENKTADARDALKDAEEDANAASDIATQAERIAEQASKVRHERLAKTMAATTLTSRACRKGGRRAYKLQAATEDHFAVYRPKRHNKISCNLRFKFSKDATSLKLRGNMKSADLRRWGERLSPVPVAANVDEVDPGRLDELERRLAEAERELERARLAERLAELQKAREQQVLWMRDYEDEINQLKKDVANVRLISEALPDKCYRRIRLEP